MSQNMKEVIAWVQVIWLPLGFCALLIGVMIYGETHPSEQEQVRINNIARYGHGEIRCVKGALYFCYGTGGCTAAFDTDSKVISCETP